MKPNRAEKKVYQDVRGTKTNGHAGKPVSIYSDETYFRHISCSTHYPGHVCQCGSPTYSEFFKSTGPDGVEKFKRVERCRRFQASGANRCKAHTFPAAKEEYEGRETRASLECPNRKTSKGNRMIPKAYGLGYETGARA